MVKEATWSIYFVVYTFLFCKLLQNIIELFFLALVYLKSVQRNVSTRLRLVSTEVE